MGSGLLFLHGARFQCLSSGACCSRYTVGAVPAERWNALREMRDAHGEPVVKPRPEKADQQLLASEGKRCVLLRDDLLCRVHAEHGIEEKPVMCRLFPYRIVQTPDGVVVTTVMECDSIHRTWETGRPVHLDAADALSVEQFAGPSARLGARVKVTPDKELVWRDYARLEASLLRALDDRAATLPEVLGAMRDVACALENSLEERDPVGAAFAQARHAPDRSPDDPDACRRLAGALEQMVTAIRVMDRAGAHPGHVETLDGLDLAFSVLARRAYAGRGGSAIEPRAAALLERPPAHARDAAPLRDFYREIFRQWIWGKTLAERGVVAGVFELTLRWAIMGPLAEAAARARGARAVEAPDVNAAMVEASIASRTLRDSVIIPLASTLDRVWRDTDVLLFLGA